MGNVVAALWISSQRYLTPFISMVSTKMHLLNVLRFLRILDREGGQEGMSSVCTSEKK